MYEYRASLIRVVDADTLDICIDLGCHVSLTERVRLIGLNAPELSTAEGKAARAWVGEWFRAVAVMATAGYLPADRPLTIRTTLDRREKYGRLLAAVRAGGRELNAELIAAGHAEPKVY